VDWRRPLILLVLAALASQAEALPRSKAARAEFQRLHPCPATGAKRGACPGWQVDHVIPLKCGGADAPVNMQWLTVHDHALKTKREARLCRPAIKSTS
jgi:5-methylcytosine-specific restriction endonuclease McrA